MAVWKDYICQRSMLLLSRTWNGQIVQWHIDDIQACMSTSCPPPVDISNPLNSFDDDLADIAIPTPPWHKDSSAV